jgi:hypothetical protein
MSDHENAVVKALIAHLAGDAALQALLGDPARIWDQAPPQPAFPHLTLGRAESRPVGAEGCGIEHVLTLSCVSRFEGAEEARAVMAAVRARLFEAALEADGVRTVNLRVTFADVFRSADQKRTYAVMRVRAVTEVE